MRILAHSASHYQPLINVIQLTAFVRSLSTTQTTSCPPAHQSHCDFGLTMAALGAVVMGKVKTKRKVFSTIEAHKNPGDG